MEALCIAFLFDSYDEVDYVFPIVAKEFEKTLEDNGFVPLAWVETGFAYMMSTGPISRVSDLKDKSIWIPTHDWLGRLEFKHFGITPKLMSLPQATTGLMTGMLDTVEGPFIAAIGLQWFTKIRYVLDTPLLYTYSVVLISKKSFDKISPEHQAIVRHAFAKHSQQDLTQQTRKDNKEARKVMIENGIKFIQADPEGVKSFDERMLKVKAEIEAMGIFTDDIAKRVEEMLQEYRAKKGNIEVGDPNR